MVTDDGGPAFPVPWETANNGMTLRDWLAGQALDGMLSSAPVADRSSPNHAGWAANAYAFADAMIEARK